MRVLVEVNHYPGILDREFEISPMRVAGEGRDRYVGVKPVLGEVPFRAGLDYVAMRELARRYLNFDVVICTNLPAIIAGKIARKMGFSGRIVFDDYGIWPWRGFLPWGPLGALFPTWARTNIISCRDSIDVVVTPSNFERMNAIRRYGFRAEAVFKIPYAIGEIFSPSVSGEQFRGELGISRSEFLITYVGRINPTKGLDRLVKALYLIRKVPARLLLVGRNQGYLGKVLRIGRSLGVLRRMKYAGTLPHERMPEVYAASDVVIIPSLYETFCFAAVEAMACGVPVVASRAGSLPEVVGGAGIICDPVPEEIAEAIERLWYDDGLRKELMRRGPVRAEELRAEARMIVEVISSEGTCEDCR